MFYIETDASQVGIGAALTQESEPDIRLPVAFASRTLQPAERRYSTTDREGLAVVWAVRYFKSYILGMPFVIVTDHSALRALRTKECLEGRMLKWAEALSEHDYDIIYIKGVNNVLPDLLSRAFLVQNLGSPDPAGLYSGETSTAAAKNRLWVHPSRREQIIRDLHARWGGHLRYRKLWAATQARFWWPNIHQTVIDVLDSCHACQKYSKARSRWTLRSILSPFPFKMVCMDTAHVTISPGKTEVFFVAVDVFTKWVEVRSAPRETSLALAAFLRTDIIQRHGCPDVILTNNGPPYAGAIFQAECHRWGLQHLTSAAYHPEGNGLAERTIGTLKRCMERLADGDLANWTRYLGLAVMAYWTLPHESTGFSPFRLLYGREAHTPAEVGAYQYSPIDSYKRAALEHTAMMRELFATARQRAKDTATKRAARWNQTKGSPAIHYQVGDLVWFDQRRLDPHPRRGLQRWIGPMTITEITPGPNYSLRGSGRGSRETFSRIHPSLIKPFRGEVGLVHIK